MSKTLIELAGELEFDSIERYFDYIIESKINGNYGQWKDLVQAVAFVGETNLFILHLEERGILVSDYI